MAIKKYLDWRGWALGFYLSWVKTLTSTLLTLGGTNLAEQAGVKGIGLSWSQALGLAASLTVIEVLKYLNAKPTPDFVTETVDTTFKSKSPDGTTVNQSSTTTTITPK